MSRDARVRAQTAMWLHPITSKQIRVLSEDWGVREADDGTVESGWFEVLRPQEKSLACGDVGDGAMKEWTQIVEIIDARLGLLRSGPTSEPS